MHYRELEFQTSPATCFESLININKKLDQYDAAIGVLKVVGQMQKKHPELVGNLFLYSASVLHDFCHTLFYDIQLDSDCINSSIVIINIIVIIIIIIVIITIIIVIIINITIISTKLAWTDF